MCCQLSVHAKHDGSHDGHKEEECVLAACWEGAGLHSLHLFKVKAGTCEVIRVIKPPADTLLF